MLEQEYLEYELFCGILTIESYCHFLCKMKRRKSVVDTLNIKRENITGGSTNFHIKSM